MATKTINISMDEELIKKIDAAAKAEFSSRSDYLRIAVLEKLNTASTTPSIAKEYTEFVKKYQKTLKNLSKR